MYDVFKALGNRKRREMLRIVLNREMHISAIAKKVSVSVPVALRHIRILEGVGLVERIRVGRSHIIKANIENIRKLGDFWNLEESFVIKVPKGTTIKDALSNISGIEFEESDKGFYINSVDGRDGYYIYEVNGKLVNIPINEYIIKENSEVELKRLVPVIGKKIKIIAV